MAGSALPASAQHVSFFPPRPSGVTLFTDHGVLADIGAGNSSGSVEIKHADGSIASYYTGRPFHIDGAIVHCINYQFASPEPAVVRADGRGFPSPWSMCSDWPRYIVVGRTVVTVTYWREAMGKTTVAVTDSLSTGRTTSAPGRT